MEEEERCNQLKRCISNTDLPIDVRAAGSLIALFGIPIARAVLLTADRIIERDNGTYLTIGEHPVLLPPSLAELLRLSSESQPRSAVGRVFPKQHWLFPGMSPGRHIAANTMSRRLRQHGIEGRKTRNTALIALAADIPASILADLLGIHINTAVYWATYAGRD